MSGTTDRATSHAEHWPVMAGDIPGDEEPVSADELVAVLEQPEGDVIALYSPAGVFTYVSAASRATLGWEPEELIGHTAEVVYFAFSPEGRAIYFKHVKKGLLDVGVDGHRADPPSAVLALDPVHAGDLP